MAFKKAVEQATEKQQQPQQNHFQQSAQQVGEGVKNKLVSKIATPMGEAMADAVWAEALRVMGEKLANGETGPLTEAMMNTLTDGVNRPFENWQNQIETWYEPVGLLPSSPESTPS